MWSEPDRQPDAILAAAFAALPELALALRLGVAPLDLAEAIAESRRDGVEPLATLIATGRLDAEIFYRGFAASLGLTFLERAPLLQAGGEATAIRREGIAPLADRSGAIRYLSAPGPAKARRMLIEGAPTQRRDIAITTPDRLIAAWRESNGRAVAARIGGSDEPGLARPSARTGASRQQKAFAAALVIPLAGSGVVFPIEAFFAVAALALPVFMLLAVMRVGATIEPEARDLWDTQRWRIDAARLPHYTVAVALLQERRVLSQLVDALAALDYPQAKLEILFLIEEEDAETRDGLAALTLAPCMRVVTVPRGLPHTKPRALNLALVEATGTLFIIYDAEDIPDRQQLRRAAARLLRSPPELACLQARLVIDNPGESWIAALFALEYAALFDVVNPGLLRGQIPILLGGTSNHFRTQALRRVGGWDAWNVTEDADIGIRLARAGYRMADLSSSTREEPPLSFGVWRRQRTRWMKGFMQTMICHLADPVSLVREAGPVASLAFVALGLGTLVGALGFPFFAAAFAYALASGGLVAKDGHVTGPIAAFALIVFVVGTIAMIAPPVVGAVRRGNPRLLASVPLLPLYYLLVSWAAWLALVEYRRDRFRWNKTAHGLTRLKRTPVKGGAATPSRPRPADARR